MSTQFQREAKISWYRSPIDSRVLAELMERDDFKGWRQTILHLGLFFLTCGISAYIWGEIDQSNWIWMLPLLFVVLFIHGTMGPFIIIAVGLGAAQFVIGNVLEPRMMGKSLNLSSLVVIISLAVWGSIWGVTGMFLSVPITVIMMIVLAEFQQTRPIAILLSADGKI